MLHASLQQFGSERQDLAPAGCLGPDLFPRDASFPWPNRPAAVQEMLLRLSFTGASKAGSFLGISPTLLLINPLAPFSSGLMRGAAAQVEQFHPHGCPLAALVTFWVLQTSGHGVCAEPGHGGRHRENESQAWDIYSIVTFFCLFGFGIKPIW